MFFGIFNYLKMSVIATRAATQTQKLNKENCFLIFSSLYIIFDIFSRKINLKIGVIRLERPDKH